MQPNISGMPEKIPTPSQLGGPTPKISQMMFSLVIRLLTKEADIEQLKQLLQVMKALQAETESFQAKLAVSREEVTGPETGDDALNGLFSKLQNAGTLGANLGALKQALQNKDPQAAATALKNFAGTLIAPSELPLPPGVAEELQSMLRALFQKNLGETLLLSTLASLLGSKKSEGQSTEQLKTFLMNKLQTLSSALPPSPFAQLAKKLLAELNTPSGAALLQQLLKNPEAVLNEKNALLASLIKELQNTPGASESLQSAESLLAESSSPEAESAALQELVAKQTVEVPFTALSTSVEGELKTLKKLIQLLLKQSPNNPQLQQYSTQLDAVSKKYPKLSEKDMGELNNIVQGVGQTEEDMVADGSMPPVAHKQYMQTVGTLLSDVIQNTASSTQSINQLLQALQNQIDNAKKLMTDLTLLSNFVQKMEQKRELSGADQKQLLEVMQDLHQRYASMSPVEQSATLKSVGALQALPNGSVPSFSFSDVTAGLQMGSWVQEFSQQNQSDSVPALRTFIENKIHKLKDHELSRPFNNALTTLLSNPAFPGLSSVGGITLGTVSGRTFVPPSDLTTQVSAAYSTFSREPLATVQTALTNEMTARSNVTTNLQGNLGATRAAGSQLSNFKTSLEKGKSHAHNSSDASDSLPDDFSNALFNHALPQQEEYLMMFAALLFFANTGSSAFLSLQNGLLDFGSANTNYNFANWLNSATPGETYAQATAQQANEETQAGNDITNAQNAINNIQSQISSIKALEKSGQITHSQAKQLESQLKDQEKNLNTAISNLNAVLADLKAITINPSGATGFTVSGNVTKLGTDEQTAINGNPNGNPPNTGGLAQIYNSISNMVSKYGSQAQTEQIQLQMRMVVFQQMMTIITSAMQMLNQMYMSFAGGIYK